MSTTRRLYLLFQFLSGRGVRVLSQSVIFFSDVVLYCSFAGSAALNSALCYINGGLRIRAAEGMLVCYEAYLGAAFSNGARRSCSTDTTATTFQFHPSLRRHMAPDHQLKGTRGCFLVFVGAHRGACTLMNRWLKLFLFWQWMKKKKRIIISKSYWGMPNECSR